MKLWVVDPRDPLLFGTGRPGTLSNRLRTLRFPLPSALAGLVRTRLGTDEQGRFDPAQIPALREVAVQGPWLARLDSQGRVLEHLWPAPRDCLFFQSSDKHRERLRLRRLDQTQPYESDLGDGLQLVGLHRQDRDLGKPTEDRPAFLGQEELRDWLFQPADQVIESYGYQALPIEERTHVAIDPKTGTALDERLFTTEALRFGSPRRWPEGAREDRPAGERLGLVFRCDHPGLREGPVFLGGERRLSHLRAAAGPAPLSLPPKLDPGPDRVVRAVLITPGIFKDGYRPETFPGGAELLACVVPRWEAVSGWNLELNPEKQTPRGPKKTRRMVPAGSVYFLKLPQGAEVRTWVADHLWMKSLCDEDEQDTRDGFGLCVVGRE